MTFLLYSLIRMFVSTIRFILGPLSLEGKLSELQLYMFDMHDFNNSFHQLNILQLPLNILDLFTLYIMESTHHATNEVTEEANINLTFYKDENN